jgi:hypothetical protein
VKAISWIRPYVLKSLTVQQGGKRLRTNCGGLSGRPGGSRSNLAGSELVGAFLQQALLLLVLLVLLVSCSSSD